MSLTFNPFGYRSPQKAATAYPQSSQTVNIPSKILPEAKKIRFGTSLSTSLEELGEDVWNPESVRDMFGSESPIDRSNASSPKQPASTGPASPFNPDNNFKQASPPPQLTTQAVAALPNPEKSSGTNREVSAAPSSSLSSILSPIDSLEHLLSKLAENTIILKKPKDKTSVMVTLSNQKKIEQGFRHDQPRLIQYFNSDPAENRDDISKRIVEHLLAPIQSQEGVTPETIKAHEGFLLEQYSPQAIMGESRGIDTFEEPKTATTDSPNVGRPPRRAKPTQKLGVKDLMGKQLHASKESAQPVQTSSLVNKKNAIPESQNENDESSITVVTEATNPEETRKKTGAKSQKALPSRPLRKSVKALESDDSDLDVVELKPRKQASRGTKKEFSARITRGSAQSSISVSAPKRKAPVKTEDASIVVKRPRKSFLSDDNKEAIRLYRQMVQEEIKAIPKGKPARQVAWSNVDLKLQRREDGNESDAGFLSDQEGMILSAKKRQKDPSDISGWNDFLAYAGTQKKRKTGKPLKR